MKTLILAAGFGSRMLPGTKTVPKEMFPIVNRPAIQYIYDEIVRAGLKDIVILTGRGKEPLESFFDKNIELENSLFKKKKYNLLDQIKVDQNINISYVRQIDPLGTGHAVLKCKYLVNSEPCIVILPDMIIDGGDKYMKQMINLYNKTNKGIIALTRVPKEKVPLYGVVKGSYCVDGTFAINGMVEKPPIDSAPSDLVLIGRYVLPNSIFKYLEKTEPSPNGEIQLTDALQQLAEDEGLIGIVIDSEISDIGNPLGYLKANLYYGLKNPLYKDHIKDYFKNL